MICAFHYECTYSVHFAPPYPRVMETVSDYSAPWTERAMLALTHGLPRGNPYPSSLLGPQLNFFPFGNLIGRGEENGNKKLPFLPVSVRSHRLPWFSIHSYPRFTVLRGGDRSPLRGRKISKDLPCLDFSPPPIKPYRTQPTWRAAGPDEDTSHVSRNIFAQSDRSGASASLAVLSSSLFPSPLFGASVSGSK
jgi:hypothetical protein